MATSNRRYHVSTWTWSVVNTAMLAGLVALLPVLGLDSAEITAAAMLITTTQAAQATILQNNVACDASAIVGKWVAVALLVAVAVFAGVTAGFNASVAAAFLSGCIYGIAVALVNGRILSRGDSPAFQRSSFWRAASIGVALVLGSFVSEILKVSFIGVVTLLLSIALIGTSAAPRGVSYSRESSVLLTLISLVAGIAATSFYRNDVNWLRASLVTSTQFLLWHYSLIFYLAIQSVVGLLTTNYAFARRARYIQLLSNLSPNTKASLSLTCLALILGALLLSAWPLDAIPAVVVASVIAVIASGASAACHLLEASIVPYLSGCFGVGLMLVVLHVGGGDRAGSGLLIELSAIAFANLLAASLLIRRLAARKATRCLSQ